MSSEGFAIRVQGLGKCYQIYAQPQDRLKQSVMPRLRSLLGLPATNYYREFWALRDVSLDVSRGETVGIIGRNGSGKSTLLQVICGTLTPTVGTVDIRGRIAALLELGTGFNPDFSGRDNVFLNGSLLGLERDEIAARFDRIAAFADIGDFIEQPVKTYSSGMVVRLGFAVAINVDPDILIIDEALAVGDELFQRKCFSRIESMRDAGATILFVSHSGSAVVELCDRAVLLDEGERIATGVPKTIVGRYQRLLYAGPGQREEIRQQIRDQDGEVVRLAVLHEPGEQGRGDASAGLARPSEDRRETFDPNLRPASTVAYESREVEIADVGIFLPSGLQVNHLVRGRTYVYSYRANFTATATVVRFGMLIKTVSGIELGGGISAATFGEALAVVRAGSCCRVAFRFVCRLNPGTYFLNAGVLGMLNGEDGWLHRLLDAAIFRVLPEERNQATGLVDFDCVCDVTLDRELSDAE
ncbi:MAG: ABC transporter ATP-binding protein [Chromatiaceae bacterium]|nr:MAG: ABC transporter ATP-binding protein [Chromatiaceae bacterium]